MKYFNSFLSEAESSASKPIGDDAVCVFGRHNPPHLGHLRTLEKAKEVADKVGENSPGQLILYTSHTQDPKNNPLPYTVKLDHLKRMFPQFAEYWDSDESVRTVIDTAKKAYNEGYKVFHFVGGEDNRKDIENLLRKYNGQLYEFQNIYSHSAGERAKNINDPISELSASKMRKFAADGDFEQFLTGIPITKKYTKQDATELFNALRASMDLDEDYNEDRNLIRERYIQGNLFCEGDYVESLQTCLSGYVSRCGANHLICVTEDGIMFKSFIHDLILS